VAAIKVVDEPVNKLAVLAILRVESGVEGSVYP
jgi:hypothetical protein